MNPETTTILYGPPGTGKTTDLLNTVSLLMDDGFKPEEICFIAFTRKAAHEAKHRAMEKFGLHEDRLIWFRTLHSLAFYQLTLNRNQVMGIADYFNIARILGLSISTKQLAEDGSLTGLTKGDRLFFMENMSRAMKLTLREYWEKFPNEDIYWYELERLQQTLLAYKQENDKRDFTDIVYQFVESGISPQVRALIVDEAQDLTPLQWQMVDKIAETVEEVYIAGDDDQAIFRWAGADIERFINLEGTRRVLNQSHRIPAKVQVVANDIAKRIALRVPKDWKPREAEGVVEFVTSISHVDMSEGTWLLLGRNLYLLEQFQQHCLQQGFVFDSSLGSPVRGTSFRAIRDWENLRKGRTLRADQCTGIYDLMSVKNRITYGCKSKLERLPGNSIMTMEMLRTDYGLLTEEIWHLAMDRLDVTEREYFLAALRRGEKLLKEPRIKISTIHGVKGGEAENVLLCTDMAERSWREFQQSPDDEHRVWYVGVTRAKERLLILQPMTNRNYTI